MTFFSHFLFFHCFTYVPLTIFIKMLALVWETHVKMKEHASKEWLLATSYAGAKKDTAVKPAKVWDRLSFSI